MAFRSLPPVFIPVNMSHLSPYGNGDNVNQRIVGCELVQCPSSGEVYVFSRDFLCLHGMYFLSSHLNVPGMAKRCCK